MNYNIKESGKDVKDIYAISFILFNLRLLVTTDTELSPIAMPAIIGSN